MVLWMYILGVTGHHGTLAVGGEVNQTMIVGRGLTVPFMKQASNNGLISTAIDGSISSFVNLLLPFQKQVSSFKL